MDHQNEIKSATGNHQNPEGSAVTISVWVSTNWFGREEVDRSCDEKHGLLAKAITLVGSYPSIA